MASLFVEQDEDLYNDNAHIEQYQAEHISLQKEEPENTIDSDIISREVSCNLPLKFQQLIMEDMLSKDGLLILGRGLGWEPLVANLIHVLNTPTGNKRGLSIILNAREDENIKISEELNELNWIDYDIDTCPPPFKIISNEMGTADKRSKLYEQGGIISLTSQVLVVDMLSGVLSPNDITGIIVLHAERVTEKSNECFIINLYRDINTWGFVKAVTDDPESFYGFSPLQTKLKNLRLSNVFLWPRFHVQVSSSLTLFEKNLVKRKKLEQQKRKFVTEINVKMTYKMNKIQAAILACTQACIGELKRHNPTLSSDYWDIENVHDKDFVQRIRLSLEPQWHRISWTSKQLVHDLSVLKGLMSSLVNLDSLEFYQLVQGILMSNIKSEIPGQRNSIMSPWLNLDEATTIIAYARERAFGNIQTTQKVELVESGEFQETQRTEYLLEELPKWDQLGQLLDDIMCEKQYTNDDGPIVIMCSTPTSISQLRQFICNMKKQEHHSGKVKFNARSFMIRKLNSYLAWKELSSLTKKLSIELEQENKEKTENSNEIVTSKTFTRTSGAMESKRRRTRGAAAVANVHRLHAGVNGGKNTEAFELDPQIIEVLENKSADSDSEGSFANGGFLHDDDNFKVIEQDEKRFEFSHIDKKDQIIIERYNEITNDSILQELHPSYIIMYEPDLSFIRRVELFQAINKEQPAKTFFMYYGNSVEEQKHLLSIKKEKEAFTRIIREKAALGKHFSTETDDYKFKIKKNDVINTRIAGGAQMRRKEDDMKIVVDTREFRSALPNYLYRIGLKVIPCMITVGDYVISPKICVERKAIPDLISSFKSGRLYNQCEQMFRYYQTPVLLIEFDEHKSFSFEPFSEKPFTNNQNPNTKKFLQQDIQSKIVMLLIAFPKLKIIWSSSPFETAQIFLTLKANQEEPDITEAISKGANNSGLHQENLSDNNPPIFNDDAIDLIKCIPGINNNNYLTLISKIKNIQQLVSKTQDELVELLGEENGRKVYSFCNRSIM